MALPTDPKARKHIPLYRGFFCYFPDAIAAVAELSMIGNEQHNPGEPLHWAREKSTDEDDALLRHQLDKAAGVPVDTDRVLHATKVAWRAMATLQKELEEEKARHPLQVIDAPVLTAADVRAAAEAIRNGPELVAAREDRERCSFCNVLKGAQHAHPCPYWPTAHQ